MTPREHEDHQHSPEEERRIREAALDKTLEGSFPASDPPSSNPNPDDHEALAETIGRHVSDRSTTRGVTASPVTVEEVKELLTQGEPIAFVDARNPIDWGSSKVKLPGAIRVPLDEVDRLLPRVPRDRRLVVYCT